MRKRINNIIIKIENKNMANPPEGPKSIIEAFLPLPRYPTITKATKTQYEAI